MNRLKTGKTYTADKTYAFESAPLTKAMITLAVPAVISELIMLVYNLTDTWFIGRTGDDNQVAAVTLVFPVLMVLTAISNLFGIGGGSLISRLLGKKDYDNARKVLLFLTAAGASTAVVFSLFCGVFLPVVLKLLNASEEIYGFAEDYIMYSVTFGGLPYVLSMILSSAVRAAGSAKAAGIGLSAGGILNMIMDPVFIFALKMNVKGAAVSSLISNSASTVILLIFLIRTLRESGFKIIKHTSFPDRDLIKQIFAIGLPASFQKLLSAFSNSVFINITGKYSAAAVAALGAAVKTDRIPLHIVEGISNGTVPLIAYNYSAENYKRQKETVKLSLAAGIIISLIGFAVLELFAENAAELFVNSPETIKLGAAFIRIRSLAIPFLSVEFMLTAVFRGIGSTKQALVLSLLRKGIVDIPLMFLFDFIFPLYGAVIVYIITETVCFTVSVVMYRNNSIKFSKNTLT